MPDKPNLDLIRSDISRALDDSMAAVKQIMNIPPNRDVLLRELDTCGFRVCLVFLEGMAGRVVIDQFILAPCLSAPIPETPPEPENRAGYIMRRVAAIDDTQKITGYQELVQMVLMGKTVMLIDGCPEALAMETRGYEKTVRG